MKDAGLQRVLRQHFYPHALRHVMAQQYLADNANDLVGLSMPLNALPQEHLIVGVAWAWDTHLKNLQKQNHKK